MKSPRIVIAFALSLVMALALGLTLNKTLARPLSAIVAGCNRFVLATVGADSGDCSLSSRPCRTIQYAIRQSASNDMICVADDSTALGPTTYTGTIHISRSLTLDGSWTAACPSGLGYCNFTYASCNPRSIVLDAQGAGRVISMSGRITPTISCFTITGGDAAGLGGDPGETIDNDAGGGIYSNGAAPLIHNNIITGNYGCRLCPTTYGRGGGIYLYNAPVNTRIDGNLIRNNVADDSTWGEGGGVMLRNSSAQLTNNTITANRAGHSAGEGGGIAIVDSYPRIADNTISANTAGLAVRGLGGGLFILIKSAVTPTRMITVERNQFLGNVAISGTATAGLSNGGGGIYFGGDNGIILNISGNTLLNNIAARGGGTTGQGGGLSLQVVNAGSRIENNLIQDNIAGIDQPGMGGGLYLELNQGTIIGNHVLTNTASMSGTLGYGGGIFVNGGNGLIQSNIINNNQAHINGTAGIGMGGGIAISYSLSTIENNQLLQNVGSGISDAGGKGGGLYILGSNPLIQQNQVMTNSAGGMTLSYGGGIAVDRSSPTLDGNILLGNMATSTSGGHGGGIHIDRSPRFTLTNNIVAHNVAGMLGCGVAIISSTGEIAHNTLVQNQGGGGAGFLIGAASQITLTNNLIATQTLGISNAGAPTSVVTARHTLFDGNNTNYGPGVTSQNPITGPAGLLPDYHLSGSSAALNQGLALAWVTQDIDGDPRPVGLLPDIGADERNFAFYLPVVTKKS